MVGNFFLTNLGRLPFGGLSLNLVQRKLLLIADSQHFSWSIADSRLVLVWGPIYFH